MNVPKVDIKQLLEAGVHLGHKTLRWNPKMKKYIFGEKNSIHIIDLTQTVDFIKNALVQVHKIIAGGGKLLIVSTKKQASEQVSELARETGQFYVNYRWLGGMLTNWNTIQNSIKRLKKLEDQLSKENLGFTKKEILKFGKEKEKLQWSLGGISEMKKTPDLIFIIDTNIESLAVAEAMPPSLSSPTKSLTRVLTIFPFTTIGSGLVNMFVKISCESSLPCASPKLVFTATMYVVLSSNVLLFGTKTKS